MLAPGYIPIKYYLSSSFTNDLKKRDVNWGYGGLSEFTFYRTYSRKKSNGMLETWADCVIRVVEGMFTILKTNAEYSHIPWDSAKADKLAQEAAERMFEFKWTPPGRGLWVMGTDMVWDKGGAALNNCAFVSTKNIETEYSKPFTFLMDMSMLGVGVGFDTKGAGTIDVYIPEGTPEIIYVEDSREGWVELIARVIDSYMEPDAVPVEPDTRFVRKYGSVIKGFGGVASGPEPLVSGFHAIKSILANRAMQEDNFLTSTDIVDIMNIIGKIVVAGNVRRTAEIAFGDMKDEDFITMKDWTKHPIATGNKCPLEVLEFSEQDYNDYNEFNRRKEIEEKYADYPWSFKFGGWRWASNNSLFGEVGMNYNAASASIAVNGEPGFAWLDNMRKYGRIKDGINNKDYRVEGGNPCLEQSLESYELCCLVENFPAAHDDYWDFQRTLKFSYLYAKIVTLMGTHWTETNRVISRNRRIGCSQSGIQEAIQKFGKKRYFEEFCDRAYSYIQHIDNKYSEWFGVPKSIKSTSVKPSGTVSLVAGALPGIHYAESESYYRTVRLSKISPLVKILEDANYRIEPSATDSLKTVVVYFPVLHDEDTISKTSVSIWEQFKNAADMQYFWADNQVSITVTFKQSEINEISRCLSTFDRELKGISLLPLAEHNYVQAPYIAADRDEIERYEAQLLPLNFAQLTEEEVEASEGENKDAILFCEGDQCQLF